MGGIEVHRLTLADLAKQPLRSPPASDSKPRSYSQRWDQKNNKNSNNNSNNNTKDVHIDGKNNELKNSVRFVDEADSSDDGMAAAVSMSMTGRGPTKSETLTEDIIEASEVSKQKKLGDDGAALLGGYFDGDTQLGESLDETMEAAIDQIK